VASSTSRRGDVSRGIAFEAILALSLEDIAQSFPHGAREVTKGRYEPADEEGATQSLDDLIKAKKRMQEKPRYLRQSYSRDNYTPVPNQALGVSKHGHGAPEEAVPEDVQRHITLEAGERFRSSHREEVARAAIRSKTARVRQIAISHIKAGMDADEAWKAANERIEREDSERAA
jgi:hypothetical protein